ncbi:MAG TPA: FmdB family zinc ribbon protein [Thermoanaerobaculia bacterium]|nr:FmdB family zinc ribbon protein [Thermoanaerobaculia bacterium]
MPLYEYECVKCGERTEVIQRHGDAPLKVCPACGGVLKKLLSAPAFQFKGSGFYVTDYGKGGAKKGEKTEEKERAKTSSKAEEAGAPATSGGGEAGGGGASDLPKGKKDGGTDAAPAAPAGGEPPAPSKKRSRDRK